MAVQLRHRHPSAAGGEPGEHAPQEDGDQPQGQPYLLPVREHGGGAAAAQGAGGPIRAAARGGGRHLRRPALLPRPRRLHDRGLHLRQPPHRAPCAGGPRHPRPAAAGASLQEGRQATTAAAAAAAASCSRGGAGGGVASTERAGEGQRRKLRRRGRGVHPRLRDEVLPGARMHAGLIRQDDRSTSILMIQRRILLTRFHRRP
uniref:Uncharacterized protein n=1 Tax=Arundo donax TaxID=35708 RepID=A0A0A9DKG8_ARUDO